MKQIKVNIKQKIHYVIRSVFLCEKRLINARIKDIIKTLKRRKTKYVSIER